MNSLLQEGSINIIGTLTSSYRPRIKPQHFGHRNPAKLHVLYAVAMKLKIIINKKKKKKKRLQNYKRLALRSIVWKNIQINQAFLD